MEAYEGYWRKMPSVKRLVYKSVLDSNTRTAMLKRGEVDLAYLLDAPQAQDIKKDPSLKLAFSGGIGTFYLDYFDQWDPKSPWHDRRGRPAAPHTPARPAAHQAGAPRGPPAPRTPVPRPHRVPPPVDPPPSQPSHKQQGGELDPRKRESQLHHIQRLVHERVRFAPILDYIWPSGVGPRVADPALMLIDPYPWSAPLEDVRLKK